MSEEHDLCYSISMNEVNRRKSAFAALLVFYLLSFTITSFPLFPQLIADHRSFFVATLFIMSALFAFFYIITARFFRSYLKTRYNFSGGFLERKSMRSNDKFPLCDLFKISIKKTSRKTIREIGLWFNDGRNIFLDGLENFEDFREKLINLTPGVTVNTSSEPLDYDSIFFYPLFGLLIGTTTALIIKLILGFTEAQMKFAYFAIGAYIFAIGCYFVLGRPLTKRYGDKLSRGDFIFGLLMALASLLIFLTALK